MKNIFLIALFAMMHQVLSAQDKFIGIWLGKVNAGVEARVIFTISIDATKKLKAVMELPDQGIKGIASSDLVVTDDSIYIHMKEFNGNYAGRLSDDSTINGYWKQGFNTALQLKKVEKVPVIQRAQTPVGPFPYKTDDVIYTNKDKSIRYGATISIPKGKGPFPAVILITGSGQQNRDEELAGHKPFAVVADHLTRKGFIVLRADDRGMGETTGDVYNATSLDFSEDVTVGIEYLKTRKETDQRRIALIGHSEGGMIAQILASQRSDIAAIVLLAGPGKTGMDVLIEQNRATLTGLGMQADYVSAYIELYTSLVTFAKKQSSTEEMKAGVSAIVENWLQKTPKNIALITTGIMNETSKTIFIDKFTASLSIPWMRYFLNYDPAEFITKISCPVFALNGSRDVQVIAKSNLAGIEESLKKSKTKVYNIREYEGLNHLFQKCKTCTVMEYTSLEETISVEVLEDIASWLGSKLRAK